MNDLLKTPQTWLRNITPDLPLLIAGPCSAESETQVLETAHRLDKNRVQVYRAGIWKPRTRPGSFEGVGHIGLKWLVKVKEETGLLTTTEIANAEHARAALDHDIDILWIGARTTVNPFAVQEIADAIEGTDKVVLLKNPVNPDLSLWIGGVERIMSRGVKNVGVIHRGFSTHGEKKYRNKPQWHIPIEFRRKLPNIPIICDPSHICGRRDLLLHVAQKSFNLNFDGLMVESHIDPDNAWSDAAQQVTPESLRDDIIQHIDLRTGTITEKYKHDLEELRDDVQDLDQQIIDLLHERMSLATRIGEIKRENNVAIFDKDQFKKVRKRFTKSAQENGLNKGFAKTVINAVHEESVRMQNLLMDADDNA